MSSSPYITTLLSATINLNPRQMDNKIYKNIKDNLIKKIEGKCYRNYGYIAKVYDIKEYSNGIMIPENPQAPATFAVKFTCKICNPLRKKKIVCKIAKINNMFVNSQNGPITVISTMNRINEEIFFIDQKTNKLMSKINGNIEEVSPGKFIIVTIESKMFNDMDTVIIALGEINRMATDEEINNSFQDEYKEDNDVTSFTEYMNLEKEREGVVEEGVVEEGEETTGENT